MHVYEMDFRGVIRYCVVLPFNIQAEQIFCSAYFYERIKCILQQKRCVSRYLGFDIEIVSEIIIRNKYRAMDGGCYQGSDLLDTTVFCWRIKNAYEHWWN